MTPYFGLTVLWHPNYYLVRPFFMHLEYKKDHTYLLVFTTNVLLSLNYLKFENKNNIILFRNFDWLTKISRILDGGFYSESIKYFYSCFISLKLKFSAIFLVYSLKKSE